LRDGSSSSVDEYNEYCKFNEFVGDGYAYRDCEPVESVRWEGLARGNGV
jgi:hypothetical protein